ncbi:hypothetical protein BG74_09155 [Sodalis-like endosymbiont of Proechinophthirus fluctus]|nr:hypothetical protein BG74_09155 [Sodalis-like endosymbiont of Proechinophthirus fluctus]
MVSMFNEPWPQNCYRIKSYCIDRRTITITFQMKMIFLNIFFGESILKTDILNNIVILTDLSQKFSRIINIEFIIVKTAPLIAILILFTKFII